MDTAAAGGRSSASAPSRTSSLGARLVIATAAAVAGTLAHALLFPTAAGLMLLGMKYLVILPGNLAMAWALALLAPLSARSVPVLGDRAGVFWSAAAPALGALVGSHVGNAHDYAGIWKFCVPAATFVLLALAPLLARLGAPSFRAASGTALAGVVAALLLGAGVAPADLDAFPIADHSGSPDLPPAAGAAGAGPDVVLISVDTLRADAILREDVPTPFLDGWRQRAMWADHALAPAPATLPSHVSMLTGVTPVTHGTRSNEGRVPDGTPALAAVFREAGWRTVGVAANYALRESAGVTRGFERWEMLAAPPPELLAAKAVRWKAPRACWLGWLLPSPLDDRAVFALSRQRTIGGSDIGIAPGSRVRDRALLYLDALAAQPRPYFFFLHFMDPHQPYQPDRSTAGRLTAGRSMPGNYPDSGVGSLMLVRRVMDDLQAGAAGAEGAAAYLHDLYHEEVMFIDDCLRQVVAKVEASGRPTLILFTADHGEQFGEHGLMIHNNSVYETLLRVPFVLSGPGVPVGETALRPHLEDVPPTLLALAGLRPPAKMEGRNLLAMSAEAGADLYVGTGLQDLAFYQGEWKLIARYSGLGTGSPVVEATALFDLAADPGEERDLLQAEPERAAALLDKARAVARLAAAAQMSELSAEDRQTLDALGYGEAH